VNIWQFLGMWMNREYLEILGCVRHNMVENASSQDHVMFAEIRDVDCDSYHH